MLIVPELETVFVLVPRTGSGSLKRAVTAMYPRTVMLWRHMEADGVPAGYDRWRRVGVVRHPVERLWSLFKWCRRGAGMPPAVFARVAPRQETFEEWLIHNETMFATGGDLDFHADYHVLHELPGNRKSQFVYLRPDLGTEVFRFEDLGALAKEFGVFLPRANVSSTEHVSELSREGRDWMLRYFGWELGEIGYQL